MHQEVGPFAVLDPALDVLAGPIGGHEIATAQLLIPHFQRAAAISRLLDARTMAAATFETVLDTLSVPVVLTGPQLQIVHANRAARALLAEGDLVRSRNNILTAQSRKKALSQQLMLYREFIRAVFLGT